MPRGGTSQRTSWLALFRHPAFLIVNVALFAAIGFSLARQTYHGWSVDREIGALEAEVEKLEGRRMRLETLTEQLVSSEHVELEARTRLGRQMPGERVVVLYGLSTTDTWTGKDVFGDVRPERAPATDLRSNPKKWWDYFRGQL